MGKRWRLKLGLEDLVVMFVVGVWVFRVSKSFVWMEVGRVKLGE